MEGLWTQIADFVSRLSPYRTENVVLYFTWLVVYTFTWVAVWRSSRAWFRFICFVVNQVFSVGVIISQVLTVILALEYWRESLAVFVVTAAVSLFLFRRRRF